MRWKIPFVSFLVGPQLTLYIGAAFNQLAMAANGGAMPVLMPGCSTSSDDWRHQCMTAATHLKFLSDWINLHSVIASVGDLLIWAGDKLTVPCLIIWATLVIRELQWRNRV